MAKGLAVVLAIPAAGSCSTTTSGSPTRSGDSTTNNDNVACPGPTTPMEVYQDLAADLRSDLFGETLVSEQISWMVERDSDASAG